MQRFAPVAFAAAVIVLLTCAATAPAATPTDPQPWLGVLTADAATETATTNPTTNPAATTEPAPAEAAAGTWPPGLLMECMQGLGLKKPMEDLGIRQWGFVEAGFTGRATGGEDPLTGRLFDARRPNNFTMNQLRYTLERTYDNTKSIDFAGRVDALYGGDAMLTHSTGMFVNAGDGQGDNWFDMLQAYGQMWIKTGEGSGLETTVGKFVTPMGFEVIDAPGNYLYSHSYLFNFAAPFAHTGVKLNYNFNPQVSAFFGIMEGWDQWEDTNHAHSYMAGGQWASTDKVDDKVVNQINMTVMAGPEQADNVHHTRASVDAYWTHNWSGKLAQVVEVNYGHEVNVPEIGSPDWWGVAHYFNYAFNDYVSATWRSEFFRDGRGSRVGVGDNSYLENTWGVTLTPFPNDKILKNFCFRPEVRWDYAEDGVFGDNNNLVTLAFDMIFKF
jgi:hypothetical protein